MIQTIGDNLQITFDSFGAGAYDLFLKAKRLPESKLEYDYENDSYTIETHVRYASLLGIESAAVNNSRQDFPGFLFEHQREIVKLALAAKRYAVWANVGLGKTLIELEFARQVVHITGGRVLIITLNEIVDQTIEECARFYGDSLPILKIDSRERLEDWCKNGYAGKADSKFWARIKDGNKDALALYERHYSCRKYQDGRERKLFVGPGEKEVLLSNDKSALFAWRKFIDDSRQKGVNCAVFRNESDELSSNMILDAMQLAWHRWNGERLYTYVNPDEIESTNPGYCFIKAGWKKCGVTKNGLIVLEAFPPRIAITNYEKMNPKDGEQIIPELRHLAGLILDESSRLKAGGGKQKWAIIKSSKGIPYKLSATATPAPNDYIEFASQASFLERMRDENEIIWTFFQRDKVTQEWTVKNHARQAFFEWMCAWSIYLKLPQSFGWSSDFKLPPEPEIITHEIDATLQQVEQARLFNLDTRSQPSLFVTQSQGVVGRSKLSQIAKGFVYLDGKKKIERIDSAKPEFIANLIKAETAAGLQTLVWTIFDEETEIIADILSSDAERRIDLEKRLKYAKAEYHRTEQEMFDGIPQGDLSKYEASIAKHFENRKKEYQFFLENFGNEIIRLEKEIDDLNKSSNAADEFVRGKDFEVLSGSTPKNKRPEILERFRTGTVPVLISKASLLGYGMNFQMCGSMIFSGWNDSFESFYQAIGRAVRYGQEKSVRIHLPFIRELEYAQLENIFRKQDQFESAILEQERAYIKAMKGMKLL